jgi:hypothetical protein
MAKKPIQAMVLIAVVFQVFLGAIAVTMGISTIEVTMVTGLWLQANSKVSFCTLADISVTATTIR